jgi:hypothetical protein
VTPLAGCAYHRISPQGRTVCHLFRFRLYLRWVGSCIDIAMIGHDQTTVILFGIEKSFCNFFSFLHRFFLWSLLLLILEAAEKFPGGKLENNYKTGDKQSFLSLIQLIHYLL